MRSGLQFLLFSSVLALTSCQVPSSLKQAAGNGGANTSYTKLLRFTGGLEGPTWDSVRPKSNIPGWDYPIDHTYFRIHTDEKVIAMTFDDGPQPENTPRLLDMLKQRKIKATFFVVGEMVENNPGLLKRMIAEGHEIGNHTVRHQNLARKSDEGLLAELKEAHQDIIDACGVAPRVMRPPGGAIAQDQKKLMLRELGYPTILWSVDPEDWKRPGVSVVTSRLVNGASPGGILLAHDLHKPTVDAMPSTLDQLLAKGYRFVTVSELIEMEQKAKMKQQAEAKPEKDGGEKGS